MKIKSFLFLFLISGSLYSFGQQELNWLKWNYLYGSWKGTGIGTPGQGDGTFSFEFKLDGNILERKSHSEYPATGLMERVK